jgi:hypothetical protein
MKSLFIVLFLLAACGLALAKEVPLPRAKPLSATRPPSLAPVPEVLPLHDAEAWPSDCALRLGEIARFAHQPSLNGPGQCGLLLPVVTGTAPSHLGPWVSILRIALACVLRGLPAV